MVGIFDVEAKFAKSHQFWAAGSALYEVGCFRQATVMFWIAVRDRIFGWLEKNRIPFDGTRTALLSAMSHLDSTDGRALVTFLYTWGVMAEWDDALAVTEKNVRDSREAGEGLIRLLD